MVECSQWSPFFAPEYDQAMQKLFKDFKTNLKVSDEAAATLCLASSIQLISRQLLNFDHQICLGVRRGLMGSDAVSSSDIRDLTVEKQDN